MGTASSANTRPVSDPTTTTEKEVAVGRKVAVDPRTQVSIYVSFIYYVLTLYAVCYIRCTVY